MELLHVLIELHLGTLKDGQGTGNDVTDLWRTVEEVLEENPYVITGYAALDDLNAEICLIACFEHQFAVVLSHVNDTWQSQLEEALILIIVDKDKGSHLVLEDNVPIFRIYLRTEALLFQELHYSFCCLHNRSLPH